MLGCLHRPFSNDCCLSSSPGAARAIPTSLPRVSMTNDLASVVSQYGLAIVFGNVLVEQIGIPVPAMPTLVVAGALAAGGKLSAVAVFAGALLGSQIERLLEYLDNYGVTAMVLVGALVAAYIAFKWWERHRFYAMLRMARISVDELHRLMDAGVAPLVVDVRSQTARAIEPWHIPGALHLPLQGFEPHIKELPRDREIILYCSCPNEASAAQVAKLLMNHGFMRVRPLLGGLEAWIAAGLPVELLAADSGIESSPSDGLYLG